MIEPARDRAHQTFADHRDDTLPGTVASGIEGRAASTTPDRRRTSAAPHRRSWPQRSPLSATFCCRTTTQSPSQIGPGPSSRRDLCYVETGCPRQPPRGSGKMPQRLRQGSPPPRGPCDVSAWVPASEPAIRSPAVVSVRAYDGAKGHAVAPRLQVRSWCHRTSIRPCRRFSDVWRRLVTDARMTYQHYAAVAQRRPTAPGCTTRGSAWQPVSLLSFMVRM